MVKKQKTHKTQKTQGFLCLFFFGLFFWVGFLLPTLPRTGMLIIIVFRRTVAPTPNPLQLLLEDIFHFRKLFPQPQMIFVIPFDEYNFQPLLYLAKIFVTSFKKKKSELYIIFILTKARPKCCLYSVQCFAFGSDSRLILWRPDKECAFSSQQSYR